MQKSSSCNILKSLQKTQKVTWQLVSLLLRVTLLAFKILRAWLLAL